jgi:antitoxin component YwqK of YwqJK toxin-antitoxin module
MSQLFSRLLLFIVFSACTLSAQTVNPNGYNQFFYENGRISSEGTMKDGKPDGYWKNYYKNGNLKIEGNRKNYELDSLWKFYDEKGRITKTIFYRNGKKNGLVTVYDTLQKPVTYENYVNDQREGLTRSFYRSGKTKSVIPYMKGRKQGTVYEYSEDSVITAISLYEGGILQSYEKINQRDELNRKQGIWKEFYNDQQVKKELKFNDDSLDGYVKEYDAKGNLTSTKKYDNGKRIMNAPEIANVEIYREVYEDGTLKYEGVYSDGDPIGTHYKYVKKRQCDSSLFRRDDTTDIFIKRMVCRNVPVPDSAIEYFDGVIIAKGKVDSLRNNQGIWYEYHYTGEFKAKGPYKDGNRIGEWVFYYASGKIEQTGRYDKKGRPQGPWKWYYESGKLLREENYINGLRDGELKEYDEEGNLMLQGSYVEGRQEGHWRYETPHYLEYGNYVNNEPDSVWKSYYMPGKIKYFEGRFEAGVPVGLHAGYHPNGARKYVGNYVGGMKEGDWKFFDENDYNYLIITYKNDIEIKWQGELIRPTYEASLRTYNIRINDNKTQTIRK